MNLVFGFLTGIISSLGFGPVSMASIAKCLSENFRSGFTIGLSAALMDFIYSGIVLLFGINFILFPDDIHVYIQLIGIILLTFIGINIIKTKPIELNSDENRKINTKYKIRYSFFYGIIIYLSTPTLLAFWVGSIAFLNENNIINNSSFLDKILFIIGVFIGTSSWFLILLSGVKSAASKINIKYIRYFIIFMGYVLIGMGLYFLMNIFLTYN
jgi:threonine/homoserine/homoserine lactone efflux protein